MKKIKNILALSFTLLSINLPASALEVGPGDFSFVQNDNVNLRLSPATNKRPITQLSKGTGFIVLERAGDWLYGDVFRSGPPGEVLKGWVHKKLLGIDFPKNANVPTTAAFEEFFSYIKTENQTSLAQTGVSRYLKVSNWGDGIVAVTVHRNWMDDDYHNKKMAFKRLTDTWKILDGNTMDEQLFLLSPSGLVLMQQ
ncbi:MAG: SH3 domain-containing protein [Alphaproteobacteria bacterium]|nr:SH3 domain-containing protein [Alphaproteobacteria bacterium]